MKTTLFTLLILSTLTTSYPDEQSSPENKNNEDIIKRQNTDFSQLLALASQAGIPVPTDNPALLLSIAPLAASLNSLLPTAPVLSALETAAPSGLISSLVHDPSFAASWISSFEQGPSPSWFLALPTSVRSYLHTYAGGGNLAAAATAAAGIESVESVVSSSMMSVSRASASAAGNVTATGTGAGSLSSGVGGGGNMSTMATGITGSGAGTTSGVSSSSTAGVMSTSSVAAAARESGVLATAAVAMAGILGLAVAL